MASSSQSSSSSTLSLQPSYLLGIDVGSSAVKVSIVDAQSGAVAAQSHYPKAAEAPIHAERAGWAEQHPEDWYAYMKAALLECYATLSAQQRQQENCTNDSGNGPTTSSSPGAAIKAIGISYQMHGLVLVDADHKVLRPSIIWCDSRAVPYGQAAFEKLGSDFCLSHLLNSPGNFTAAKLAWVKANEPDVYSRVHKFMLPGDYVAMRLTDTITTTVEGLSECILWDFKESRLSTEVLGALGIDERLVADVRPTFSVQGLVTEAAAVDLGLAAGTPVSYRAGDQPNNALSLNVMRPGEVAATGGTSGVVYGVLGEVNYDRLSRVNTFAHVNHQIPNATRTVTSAAAGGDDGPGSSSLSRDGLLPTRLGVLLCINGTGSLNSWMKRTIANGGAAFSSSGIVCGGEGSCSTASYKAMNALAATVPIGAEGVTIIPFGNGTERVLQNKQDMSASITGLNFNTHGTAHLLRAGQEGIAFAFAYGMEVMAAEMGMRITTIKAGHANLFLSPLFREALAATTGAAIELYDTDGSVGAAKGAAIGAGIYANSDEAFATLKHILTVHAPSSSDDDDECCGAYRAAYGRWKVELAKAMAPPPSSV